MERMKEIGGFCGRHHHTQGNPLIGTINRSGEGRKGQLRSYHKGVRGQRVLQLEKDPQIILIKNLSSQKYINKKYI